MFIAGLIYAQINLDTPSDIAMLPARTATQEDQNNIATAICEIRCVCTLLQPERKPGHLCGDMAKNIAGVLGDAAGSAPKRRRLHSSVQRALTANSTRHCPG